MKKQTRLTPEQKNKIYALYDKNIKEIGQPDYESIAQAMLRETPPVLITKEAICYQIKQRAKRAKAAVLQAEQNLNQAKEENFKVSGEQPQELKEDEVEETDEITIKNSTVMLKYYMAMKAKAEYEKVINHYVHIDELTREFKELHDLIERELNSFKKRVLSQITDKIKQDKNTEAQALIDSMLQAVLLAVRKKLTV